MLRREVRGVTHLRLPEELQVLEVRLLFDCVSRDDVDHPECEFGEETQLGAGPRVDPVGVAGALQQLTRVFTIEGLVGV